MAVATALTLAVGFAAFIEEIGWNRKLLTGFIYGAALVGFPSTVLTIAAGRLAGGRSVSIWGVTASLWGLQIFLLPRLWIALEALLGEAYEQPGLGEFWELAWVGFVYLPAIAAAVALPPLARCVVFLAVAAAGQAGAVAVSGRTDIDAIPYLALPATILLLVATLTSLSAWRETARGTRRAG